MDSIYILFEAIIYTCTIHFKELYIIYLDVIEINTGELYVGR